MNKIPILVKKDILGILDHIGLNKHSTDHNEKKHIFLIIVSFFTLISMYYLFSTYLEFSNAGYRQLGILFAYKLAFGILFFVDIYFLYEIVDSREYLLLNSLPLSKKSIISSKLLVVYMCDCLIEVIIFLPLCVLMGIEKKLIDIATYFLVTPVVIIFICSLIIIALVMINKLLNVNAIVKTVGLLVSISLLIVILINNKFNLSSLDITFLSMNNSLSKPWTYVLSILITICLGYLAIIVLDIGIKSNFKKTYISLYKGNYKYVPKKKNIAVFIGELRQYGSIPTYVLNTALGLILILFFSLSVFLSKKGMGVSPLEIPYGLIKDNINVFPYVMSLLTGVCCTTQVSLSLEGKCIWIKKMLPIADKNIYLSKVIVGLILMIPVGVVSSILILKSENILGKDVYVSLVLLILNLLLISIIGILINIKFVDYEWNNPISVIKRSSASIIYQILNLLINIICIVLIGKFRQSIDIRFVLIGVEVILIIYIFKIIMRKSIPDQ